MSQSTARRTRAAAITSAAVAAGFLLPSAAHAVVTTTTVTSPAPETIFDSKYSVLGGIGDRTMTVTGLAPDADDGDEVVLVCTYTLNGIVEGQYTSREPLTVRNGAFSTTEAYAPALPCRLRAVPADFDPEDTSDDASLAAWTGPRLIGGGYETVEDTNPGSSSFGAQTFLTQRGQRRGLAFAFGAGGSAIDGGIGLGGFGGGIYLTALLDDTFYRPLFGPSAFLTNYGFGTDLGDDDEFSLRNVGLVVDGQPALPVAAVGAERSKVVSRDFDPESADQTIVEQTPIARVVLDGDGNPEGFMPSGLQLRRTTKQDRDGRRISLNDEFLSTDGAAHRIETRYLQALYSSMFTYDGDTTIKEPASYRFPWATGDAYVEPGAGDEYGPAPAGPTTIWVHGARQDFSDVRYRGAVGRADDGLLPRAEGAYQFDSAPSSVKFLDTGIFVANFVRDVPAAGSASVGQTFLQDLTEDGLEDLVEPPNVPATPPVPPAPPIITNTPLPTQVPVLTNPLEPKNPLPKLAKSTGKVLFTKKQGQRLRDRKPITVTTSNMPAGRYGVTIRRWVKNGRTLASGVKTIKKDGRLKVKLRLSKYGKKYFGLKKTRNRKSVKVRVIVTWTPPGKGRLKQKTSYTTNFR